MLFQPARLVTFSRIPGERRVEMLVGAPGDSWRAIDEDPSDGALWVASEQNVSLMRLAPNGERSIVDGPRVTGRGGFSEIRLDAESIFATPTGADDLVWRLSRSGQLLGRSFSRPAFEQTPRLEARGPSEASLVILARAPSGSVVALEALTGRLFRADADGRWTATGEQFPIRSDGSTRTVKGEAVGSGREIWYLAETLSDVFFIGSTPVALGPQAAGTSSRGTMLFRPGGSSAERALEPCARGGIRKVVSDGRGFVAFTGSFSESSGGRERISPPEILLGRFGPF